MGKIVNEILIIAGLVVLEVLLALTDGLVTIGISGILILYTKILDEGRGDKHDEE